MQGATAAEAAEGMAILRGLEAEADRGDHLEEVQVVDQADQGAQEARAYRVDLEVLAAAVLAEVPGEITAEEGVAGEASPLQAVGVHRQVATQVAEAPVRPVTGRREQPDAGQIQRCLRSCDRLRTRSRFSSKTT